MRGMVKLQRPAKYEGCGRGEQKTSVREARCIVRVGGRMVSVGKASFASNERGVWGKRTSDKQGPYEMSEKESSVKGKGCRRCEKSAKYRLEPLSQPLPPALRSLCCRHHCESLQSLFLCLWKRRFVRSDLWPVHPFSVCCSHFCSE